MATGQQTDVVVVGGGIIGCAVAREAARSGHRVTLLEAERAGRGATVAAAGMLSPLVETGGNEAFRRLGLASLDLYPAWTEALREESGVDPALLPCGRLRVALTPREGEELDLLLARALAHDPGARRVEGTELGRAFPGLDPGIRSGLLLERDHQVDNRLLARALVRAALRAGVRVREGAEVREILRSGGRVIGVALQDGTRIEAPRVVLAAGAWGGQLRGIPHPPPLVPVRGQMVALGPVPGLPPRLLEGAGVYVVPRRTGRILVGATVERVGFRKTVTPEGVSTLLRGVRRLLPLLRTVPPTEVWAGLRPGTPDDLPLLGPDPHLEGLEYAGGHFRNGILLAPITARLVLERLEGRAASIPLEPFLPGRFHPASRS